MNKKVVFIDDEDISSPVRAVKRRINQNKEINFRVECSLFNPVDNRFALESGEIDFENSLKTLISEEFISKVDLVACDFNLHRSNKILTFEIIKHIRSTNKACVVVIYSGGLNRSLLEVFKSLGKKAGEKALYSALSSNISAFIGNRRNAFSSVENLLSLPSIELEIDNLLTNSKNLEISHGYHGLKFKNLGEIATEIRKGSSLGKKYLNEIIERGISHMINLNES